MHGKAERRMSLIVMIGYLVYFFWVFDLSPRDLQQF